MYIHFSGVVGTCLVVLSKTALISLNLKPASHCPTDQRIRGSDGKSDEKSGSGRK